MKAKLIKISIIYLVKSLLIRFEGGLFCCEVIQKGNLIGEYFGEKMEKLEL